MPPTGPSDHDPSQHEPSHEELLQQKIGRFEDLTKKISEMKSQAVLARLEAARHDLSTLGDHTSRAYKRRNQLVDEMNDNERKRSVETTGWDIYTLEPSVLIQTLEPDPTGHPNMYMEYMYNVNETADGRQIIYYSLDPAHHMFRAVEGKPEELLSQGQIEVTGGTDVASDAEIDEILSSLTVTSEALARFLADPSSYKYPQ